MLFGALQDAVNEASKISDIVTGLGATGVLVVVMVAIPRLLKSMREDHNNIIERMNALHAVYAERLHVLSLQAREERERQHAAHLQERKEYLDLLRSLTKEITLIGQIVNRMAKDVRECEGCRYPCQEAES